MAHALNNQITMMTKKVIIIQIMYLYHRHMINIDMDCNNLITGNIKALFRLENYLERYVFWSHSKVWGQ